MEILVIILLIVLDLISLWLIRRITIIQRQRDEARKHAYVFSRVLRRVEDGGVNIKQLFDEVTADIKREEEVRDDDSRG